MYSSELNLVCVDDHLIRCSLVLRIRRGKDLVLASFALSEDKAMISQ